MLNPANTPLDELIEQARVALQTSPVWHCGSCHVSRSCGETYSAEGHRLRFTANLSLEEAVSLALGQHRANCVSSIIGRNHAKD